MTRSNALIILGLKNDETDAERWADACEDKVFELVNFFMRRAFIPRLALAKIKRLDELEAAKKALDFSETKVPTMPKFDGEAISNALAIGLLITTFHAEEARLKGQLAAALDAYLGKALYLAWIEIFSAYAQRFVELYEAAPFYREADGQAKISEEPDSTTLVAEFNSGSKEKPMLHKAYSRYKKLL